MSLRAQRGNLVGAAAVLAARMHCRKTEPPKLQRYQMTPAPCATAHPFPTLYLSVGRQAQGHGPTPDARRQPTSEYRVHRVRVITANRCHRTWSQMRLWRTARRIPLHRWLSQRPVISPVPHRPVRRVSPPLREGRPLPPACPVLDTGSFRRKSQTRLCVSKIRLWRVEDAPLACRRCAFGVPESRRGRAWGGQHAQT